jgi:DNA-binding response OmpR family regulator
MINKVPKILYVEDDLTLSYVTKDNLELKGYKIYHCDDGLKALDLLQNEKFDLCILDIMLPKMDGFSLAEKIREKDQDIPIIFLTAKSMLEDRIKGLTIGGDDYLTKPFSIEELVLKIEVFLKRSRKTDQNTPDNNLVQIGEYTFDPNNLSLILHNTVTNLTSREADLLKYLCNNLNSIVKREDILIAVWGDDSYFLSRSLDVFISRLRKYLKEDKRVKIRNVHGVGFCLSVSS